MLLVGKMKVVLVCCRLLIVCSLLTSWSSWRLTAAPYPLMAERQAFTISNAQQAAKLVKGQFGGKVLKVQRVKVNGNPGYKVKLLKDNGHVVSVKVDAKSGQLSGN